MAKIELTGFALIIGVPEKKPNIRVCELVISEIGGRAESVCKLQIVNDQIDRLLPRISKRETHVFVCDYYGKSNNGKYYHNLELIDIK